jgi:hypothetical protein
MHSSEHTPFCIIPQRGQVSENSSKPARSEHWAVFHERVSRSNLANNPCELRPQATSLAVDACAFSCRADILAWEAARNHVNNPAPRSTVKGANVVPNRERREKSVVLAGAQNSSGVGVALNSAHGSPSEEFASEYAATSAREKSQLIHAAPFANRSNCAPALLKFAHACLK